MRGLPPLPTDFVTLTVGWRINDGACTTSWHIFNPGSHAASIADLHSFISGWFFNALPELLPLLGSDCSASTCRLSTVGTQSLVYNQLLAPNVGSSGTTNPLNGDLCLTWRTNDGPLGGRSHTLLPLSDSLVDTDHRTLKQIAWAFAVSQAELYLEQINALPSVDGGLCVAAVVHRALHGQPLHTATWSPVTQADACQRVGTIQRRTRARRPLSPF